MTKVDFEEYTLFDGLIQEASPEAPRAGEGSAIGLRDDSVLFFYSHFTGSGDDAPASIVKRVSKDRGRTWSAPVEVQKKQGESHLNVMSASLLRLQNGSIAFVFLEKPDSEKCVPYIRFSNDEGETWTEPEPIDKTESGYYSVNNDRLCMASNGRIFLPFNQYESTGKIKRGNNKCGVFYSDDNGLTWDKSGCLTMKRENVIPPANLHESKLKIWNEITAHGVSIQEPGVVELPDGGLMMWVRTNAGYMYSAFSKDNGESWDEFKAVPSITSPLSPQSIKRIPGSSRLVCIYNDHRDYAFAEEPWWNWRTPLSAAISESDGKEWRFLGNIEGTNHNYCYTSILFLDDTVLLTYYQSDNCTENKKETRRNLASLKMKAIKTCALL